MKHKFSSLLLLAIPFLSSAFINPEVNKATPKLNANTPITSSKFNVPDIALPVHNFLELQNAIGNDDVDEIVFANDIVCSNVTGESAISLPSGKTKKIYGNAFAFSAEVTGATEDGTINSNASNYSLIKNEGHLILSNLIIRGGAKTAINNPSSSSILEMEGCTVERSGSAGEQSGGLINDGGKAYIKTSKFSRNNAHHGGAFTNTGKGGWIIMDSCSITENRSLSTEGGGGAGENGSYLIMNNCTIANNTSFEIGGAINCNNQGNKCASLVNCTVTGNITRRVVTYGGGIGIRWPDTHIYAANSIFSDNYSYSAKNNHYYKHYSDFGQYGQSSSAINNWHIMRSAYNGSYYGNQDNPTEIVLPSDVKKIGEEERFSSYISSPILETDGTAFKPSGADNYNFKRPVIIKSANDTYIAPITGDDTFCTGGTNIYLSVPTDVSTWSTATIAFGYGDDDNIQTFSCGSSAFKTPTADDKITVFQDGSTRDWVVMGAAPTTTDEYCTITVVPGENGTVSGASIYGDAYLKGTPISLFAVPNDGYALKGWKNVDKPDDPLYEPSMFTNYPLNESMKVQPVFSNEGVHTITNECPHSMLLTNHGYVLVNPSGIKDDLIGVTSHPLTSYALKKIEVYKTDDPSITIPITNNKFVMPDFNVTVKATFVDAYQITNKKPESEKDMHYGYLEVVSEAAPTSEVEIKAHPVEHYALSELKVYKTDDPSTTIPITNNKFVMPSYPVTVDATFLYGFNIENARPESEKDNYHGYLEIVSEAAVASEVEIKIHPNEGYSHTTLQANSTDGHATVAIKEEAGIFTFTMPNFDVVVSADFGATHSIENLSPEAAKETNHGYVDVVSTAATTADIKIDVKPNTGYVLSELEVYKTGDPGTRVPVTDYKFTMPDYNVSVKATFVAAHSITNLCPEADVFQNHGYIKIDKSAAPNTEVMFEVHPAEHYALSELKVYKTGDPSTTIQTKNNKFTMPDYDITIDATFARAYGITNMSSEAGKDINHGYIAVLEEAVPNTKVDVEIKPNVGYALKNITAFKLEGSEPTPVEIIMDAENKCHFIMPDFAIKIEATFDVAIKINNESPESKGPQNHGYIKVVSSSVKDNMVTIDVHADSGYRVESIKVYKTGSPDVSITVENNQFKMPNYEVTIVATFTTDSPIPPVPPTPPTPPTPSNPNCFYHWISLAFTVINVIAFAIFTFIIKNKTIKIITCAASSIVAVVLAIIGAATCACAICIALAIVNGAILIAEMVTTIVKKNNKKDDDDDDEDNIDDDSNDKSLASDDKNEINNADTEITSSVKTTSTTKKKTKSTKAKRNK